MGIQMTADEVSLSPDNINQMAPRLASQLASDIFLPSETVEVRAEVRAFAETVLRSEAHSLNTNPERRDGFRRDIFEAIVKAGLYTIPFAADVGGRGLAFPTVATMSLLEEIAYFSAGVASAMYDAQVLLVGKTLDSAGGIVRDTFLPKLVRGEFVASFATSEPAASTDLSLSSIATCATPTVGGWLVNGRKRWITNSPAADYITLLCRTGENLSLLFADMHQQGVTVLDPDLKMGNHAQLTADVILENVFVPDDNVIGPVGAGLRSALASLVLGRIGIGAIGVGMAQRALDEAVHYTSQRTVYGKPIASNQFWQYRFAEHAIAIESARSLYQKAAMLTDRNGDNGTIAAMAKVQGSTVAVDVARDAIQSTGGYGFARHMPGTGKDWPLEAIYRDAKVGEIYEGANEIQKWIIARKIFGRDIAG